MAFQEIGVRAVVKGFAQYQAQVGAMQSTTAKFGGFLKTGLKVGAVAAAVGIGLSIKSFADFDAKMTQSLAIMDDVSDAMRTKMANSARQMAKETTFSAKDAAESYFFLASAGLDAEQSLAALPIVARFGQAGMFDMALATDLLTDAQSALGLKTEDTAQNMENMTRVGDVLVKMNQMANASVEQFATALKEKGAAALRGANIELEKGAGLLAYWADQGLKGSAAGSQLAGMLLMLPKIAIKNADAFERYGVELFDAEGKLISFSDIAREFEPLLEGMTDAQRAQAFEQMGINRLLADSILKMRGGADAIDAYTEAAYDAAGATEEVARKQLEHFNAQLGLLMSEVNDVAIGLGSKIVPALVKLIKLIRTSIIPAIKDKLIPALKRDLKPILAALIPIFALLAVALWNMVAPLLVAAAPIVAVGLALAGLGAILFVIEKKTGLFSTIWEKVVDIFKRDVLPTLKDLGRLMKGLLKEAMETVINLWENLQPPLRAVWQLMQDKVLPVFERIGQFLRDHRPLLVAIAGAILLLTNPWLAVAAAIVIVLAKWDAISQMFTQTIPAAIDRLLDKIKSIPVIGKVVEIWLEAQKRYWETAFKVVVNVVKTSFALIKNRFETALKIIKGVFDTFKAVFTGDWKKAWESLKQIFIDAFAGVKDEIGIILGGIKEHFDILWGGISGGATAMVNAILGAFDWLVQQVSKALNLLIKAYNATIGRIPLGPGKIEELQWKFEFRLDIGRDTRENLQLVSDIPDRLYDVAQAETAAGKTSLDLASDIGRLSSAGESWANRAAQVADETGELPPAFDGAGDAAGGAGDAFRGLDEDLAALRETMRSTAEVGLAVLNEAIQQEEDYLLALAPVLKDVAKEHEFLQGEVDKVTASIQEQEGMLSIWRDTALTGTQAFSDAAFALSQETDRLQRSINEIKIGVLEEGLEDGGYASDELTRKIRELGKTFGVEFLGGKADIEDINKVLEAARDEMTLLGLEASNVQLDKRMQIDPFQRKLDKLFDPILEADYDEIVANVTRIQSAISDLNVDLDDWNKLLEENTVLLTWLEGAQANHQEMLANLRDEYSELEEALEGVDPAIKAIWEARGGEVIDSIEAAFDAIDRGQKGAAEQAMADAMAIFDDIKALVPGAETGVFAPIEAVLKEVELSVETDIGDMTKILEDSLGDIESEVLGGSKETKALKKPLKDTEEAIEDSTAATKSLRAPLLAAENYQNYTQSYLRQIRDASYNFLPGMAGDVSDISGDLRYLGDEQIDILNSMDYMLYQIWRSIDDLAGAIPTAQRGMYIDKPGLVGVHAGELILPARRVPEVIRDRILQPRVDVPVGAEVATTKVDIHSHVSGVAQQDIAKEVDRAWQRAAFRMKGT